MLWEMLIELGLLFLLMLIWMSAAFRLARKWQFYSLVDVAWAYGFLPVAIALAVVHGPLGSGSWPGLVMVCAWGLRLGTHLFVRLRAHFPTEDRRYQKLRLTWSEQVFRGFFIVQGASVALLSIPMMFHVRSQIAWGQSAWHWIGLTVFLVGFFGESLADKQLAEFKSKSANRGAVCNVGLWKYSRHPNYFFEFVIWCGFSMVAWSVPWGALSVIAPLTILYLLLNVTGVKPAEEQSLQSRGDAYRAYQAKTSAFFPWFPLKKEKV